MSEKEAKITDQAERIKDLEGQVANRDKKIKELEAKSLRMEIDALETYKGYDLKIAEMSADLANLRGYAVSVKAEQYKALAPEPKKG